MSETKKENVAEEAIAQSEAHINDYLFRGGTDTEVEDIEVGEKLGVGETIRAAWADAKATEKAWLEQEARPIAEASSFLPKAQPEVEKSNEVENPKEPIGPKAFPRRKLGKTIQLVRKPDGEWVAQDAAEPKEEPKEEEAAIDGKPTEAVPALVPASPSVVAADWDDAIAAMNRQHAIIENVGGKAVIASWEPSTIDPSRLVVVFQNKESFLLRYSNRFVSIEVHSGRNGTVRMPLGQWWLGHRDRQQYRE